MRFFLCEIEHKGGVHCLALPSSELIGVSTLFVPAPQGERVFGFAEYEGRLYPIVTHAELEMPVFKYFAIYQKFAFGVTRILAEVESTPTPLTEKLFSEALQDSRSEDVLKDVSHYSGIVVHEGQIYYVYNFTNLRPPVNANVVRARFSQKVEERQESIGNFILLGEKYAVRKDQVKTILSANLMTPFKVDQFDGFIDYGRIIPVISLDNGEHVVVLENIAYRTGKIQLANGVVLEHPEKGEKVLETDMGTFKIIEV